MPARKQQNLFNLIPKKGRRPQKPHHHFGGMYLKNYNPKSKRPMDSKKALHVVLKSSHAVGIKSFKRKEFAQPVWNIIDNHATKNGIKIYEYANSGNHLHILLRAKHRDEFNKFIRTITGLIARLVGKSEKGHPLKKKFWDARPFSRVVSFSSTEFRIAKAYLLRNTLEAIGWLSYTPRDRRRPKEVRQWLMPKLE